MAALLMKEAGYDCIGVTMKLYDNDMACLEQERTCCTLSDIEDARSVAYHLGMPYYVFNFKSDFKEKVIDKFICSYQNGATPNPCIDCNRYLKFEHLYRRAKELGCDVIVTGHYARVQEEGGHYHLLKGMDVGKDQSYVLYSLSQEQLSHTVFPLGEYSKTEIREIAQKHGFVNAEKKESQDICFIPDGDYVKFIQNSVGKTDGAGYFKDKEGNILGKHDGYYGFTIGQRRGLGIAAASPYYVIDICPEDNTVVLGSDEDLFHTGLLAEDFNWIEPIGDGAVPMKAKIRYRHKEQDAVVRRLEDGMAEVRFREPQRAITKGQAVVLYDGDKVVGGGTIREWF